MNKVTKRRPLQKNEARNWASMLHVLFIDSLLMSTSLSLDHIVFHGGTNLHLSWASPRFSEDLDFLASRDFSKRIPKSMKKIETRMKQIAIAHDPELEIQIQDKTKDHTQLLNYRIVMKKPYIIGQTMVKAEFWQVDSGYLERYQSVFMTPKVGLVSDKPLIKLSLPVPVARLEAAFADKIIALAFRNHLKWRDLFDLWWISKQINPNPANYIHAILHHAQAYSKASIKEGLEKFLSLKTKDILTTADSDLKLWLPEPLWNSLWPDGVQDMVLYARNVATELVPLMPPTFHDGINQEVRS